MAKFCKYCGKKLEGDLDFCSHCHKKQSYSKEFVENSKEKSKKKEKVSKSFRRKIADFFLRILVLISAILLMGISLGALVYFGVLDIPIVHRKLEQIGLEQSSVKYYDSHYHIPERRDLSYDESRDLTYVNNIILLLLHPGVGESDAEEIAASIEGEIVGKNLIVDQYQVQVKPSTIDELEDLCKQLKEDPRVFEAFYDIAQEVEEQTIPNDPWGKEQTWDLEQPAGNNWWAEAVDAPKAWDINSSLSPIAIGIVDTGFDLRHEDLKGRIVYTSKNNKPDDHGTHVAGIVGALANNDKGLTGLVWDCDLYTYDWELNLSQKIGMKFRNFFRFKNKESWNTNSHILEGVLQLVEKDVKIINLSLGYKFDDYRNIQPSILDENAKIASAYLNALLTRGYDFLLVNSAGNGDRQEIAFDAAYNNYFTGINEENCTESEQVKAQDIIDRILVVGAAAHLGNHRYIQASFSNGGDRVDICAPGVDIYSAVKTKVFKKYETKNGTSMAAPIVTGIASMVWAYDPQLTGAEVKAIVCDPEHTKYMVEDNPSPSHPLVDRYPLVNGELALKGAEKWKSRRDNQDKWNRYTEEEEGKVSIAKESLKPKKSKNDNWDIVLALDSSYSMVGSPLEEIKKSTQNFIDSIGDSQRGIGLVTYSDEGEVLLPISLGVYPLKESIKELQAGGNTNMEDGLKKAFELLEKGTGEKKILVLMSDGEPNVGKVGEELITYANAIKEAGITIYTFGYFESLYDKTEAQYLMEQIASEGCHYETDSLEDLLHSFKDMTAQISGQKNIYIRIACPVDVSVTYEGQSLDSRKDRENLRTSFGVLSFEEGEGIIEGEDRRIKILRLKEGGEYPIRIEGNGWGTMDYTIGFMDDQGTYNDLRRFEKIPVNGRTLIETEAKVASETLLKVDQNGDGKFDLKYRAGVNALGEEVKTPTWLFYVLGGVLVILGIDIIILIILRKTKGRRRR